MNGKKGSIRIDIPAEAVKKPAGGGAASSEHLLPAPAPGKWIRDAWAFAKEDTNRVKFALKAGLAVLLVSFLILLRATYEVFGTNIIWSILTVAIMFEYTVGATFNRGFNRALGSLLAGIFAVVVLHVAMATGHLVEPYVLGVSIFFIGAVTSFMKLWPSLAQYEYGFRVILFTYCLIIVSGYRVGNPLKTAMDRLYSIAIGGLVAVLVNVLVYPIWASELLHAELVKRFNTVADSLEECVNKYLKDNGSDSHDFSQAVADDFQDEPAFKKCRATLNSSAKLDSLANSAKWEPPHGRFRHFFYPWSEYVKVGAVLNHCAYEVMALHGCLHSEIQAPYNLRTTFQSEILDATNHAAELLRTLAKDINNMKRNIEKTLLKRVHSSAERLQRSVDIHSYLFTSSNDSFEPQKAPSRLSNTFSFSLKEENANNGEANTAATTTTTTTATTESYHEAMRKQQRRLYSWPSREVDEFGEESVGANYQVPKMRALESTAALSLATFTSLLIEFMARLDHLVDAVDELAKMAKFRQECA